MQAEHLFGFFTGDPDRGACCNRTIALDRGAFGVGPPARMGGGLGQNRFALDQHTPHRGIGPDMTARAST